MPKFCIRRAKHGVSAPVTGPSCEGPVAVTLTDDAPVRREEANMTPDLESAYAAGADDHEHVCSGTGAHAPESLEALVASTGYWVTPPESPAHAEAWARGWLAAHQTCVAQGVARARADAAEDAAHQPEVQLDLADDADLREACRGQFARYDYTSEQVDAWVRQYRESATCPSMGR